MDWLKKENQEKVLQIMCKTELDIYGEIYVFSSREIAIRAKMSRQNVIKILHELHNKGLVEKASQGCPAQVSCGEVTELICDAAPPKNGWSLTDKSRESSIYKAEQEKFNKSLEKWANGSYNEEENSNG